ncbi:MAG: hypothetical protein M5U33_00380 [Pseudorhodoplanes sp.]|nr:hypothetical protein [Pseudorhodoplanes sp.]
MASNRTISQTVRPVVGFAVRLTMALSIVVFLLMMLLGLIMRMVQGSLLDIPPDLFIRS